VGHGHRRLDQQQGLVAIMTARATGLGCIPFRMTATDYLAALAAAVTEGVVLPHDASPVPATGWDPDLAAVFAAHRLVVHEERVMDDNAARRFPATATRSHLVPVALNLSEPVGDPFQAAF
jgi:hypothetical protein